mmetsp:Transcript_89130/g.252566  ORF Transcript_89130/g.252566 Transcript_89130/m.252566 type:complete len:217 (-) Transcript_89130:188-838(-)
MSSADTTRSWVPASTPCAAAPSGALRFSRPARSTSSGRALRSAWLVPARIPPLQQQHRRSTTTTGRTQPPQRLDPAALPAVDLRRPPPRPTTRCSMRPGGPAPGTVCTCCLCSPSSWPVAPVPSALPTSGNSIMRPPRLCSDLALPHVPALPHTAGGWVRTSARDGRPGCGRHATTRWRGAAPTVQTVRSQVNGASQSQRLVAAPPPIPRGHAAHA